MRSLVLSLFVFASACGGLPPTCSEPDIGGWVLSVKEWASPIHCDAKLIGYRLDIDSSKDTPSRTISLMSADPAVSSNVTIAADIDMQPGITRVARIIQGPVTRAESLGTITTVSASTTTAVPGQMLSEFAITVDGGTHYIGEIRNVRKR